MDGKCNGSRCPMQVGFNVENCDLKDCMYRTEGPNVNDLIINALMLLVKQEEEIREKKESKN